MPGTVGSVLIVSMNDGFCVAFFIKGVAKLLQLFAKFAVVIDLAIESNPGSALLIGDRLLAAFQIDDRQPSHAQAHTLVEVEAVIIRAAMFYRLAHSGEKRLVHEGVVILDDAYNATHKLTHAGTNACQRSDVF